MCASSVINPVTDMQLRLLRIALLPLLLTAPAVHAGDDATAWLERMSQAAHSRNFVGTFVYIQEGRLETMQLVHAVDESGEHERLVSLSGAPREVIREHGQVTCFLPERDALVANHPSVPPGFPLNLPTQWAQLQNVYQLQVLDTSRVAGQEAQHIAIVPRDQLRYGQNYWVAVDSGLLLRTDVVNESGEVMEQLEFTSLRELEHIPPEMLAPGNNSRVVTRHKETTRPEPTSTPQQHWQVTNLPQGFELELQRRHAITDDGVAVEHLIYSDGLASVSVFIEPRGDNDAAIAESSQRGSVNAYTRLMPQQRVTVLGEVPMATVRQIGESLEPVGR